MKEGAAVIDVGINAVPDATKKAGHRHDREKEGERAREIESERGGEERERARDRERGECLTPQRRPGPCLVRPPSGSVCV